MTDTESHQKDHTKASFKVYGLDCAEEIEVLKAALGPREGVDELDFHVLNGRMNVFFDPEVLDAEDIMKIVAGTGMKAVPWESREEETAGFWQLHGRLVLTTLSGIFLVGGFVHHWMMHGRPFHGMIGGEGGLETGYPLLCVILYGIAVVLGAWFVVPKAYVSLRNLRPDMNLLMMAAVIGAMFIGEWFEAATVAFLFSVALLLEQWSVSRARNAIESLLDISPDTALYFCPHHEEVEEKPVEEIAVGDTVVVRPGDKIPLDGNVTRGITSVNEAPITGESMPVKKEEGDPVYAGTINDEGAIHFEVTRRAEDTTLARIIHMVEEAESRRAPAEQWVEKFARYYTPVMMFLAIGVALVPPLMGGGWEEWLYRGLVILVISCPCALVISTPVSIVAGLASAARNGILIKGGVYLESAGDVRVLALDKTGTLTHGVPDVQSIVAFNEHTEEEILRRAAALESHSEHPLARAIRRRAEEKGLEWNAADNYMAIKGKGGEGYIDGRIFWIGSHRLMEEKGEETPQVHAKAEQLEEAGHSVVALGNDDHVCGLISLADSVRDESQPMVQELQELGVDHVIMLTGDNEGTARAVADQAGVTEYRSELLPEDKVEAVEELVEQYGHVGMVGDGINDAPAMARANFGVAMGAMGTDAAIETADVALMSDDLSRLPWLIRHSNRTVNVIKQNIGFALGLKALFIILALAGLATLWMAIAADMGASLLVIFNGLRLLKGSE